MSTPPPVFGAATEEERTIATATGPRAGTPTGSSSGSHARSGSRTRSGSRSRPGHEDSPHRAPRTLRIDPDQPVPADADLASYDSVVAVEPVPRVPYAWIQLVRPGGRLVVSWRNPFAGSVEAHLTVTEDGRATGHFVGWSGAPDACAQASVVAEAEGAVPWYHTTTTLDPEAIWADPAALFGLGIRLPHLRWARTGPGRHEGCATAGHRTGHRHDAALGVRRQLLRVGPAAALRRGPGRTTRPAPSVAGGRVGVAVVGRTGPADVRAVRAQRDVVRPVRLAGPPLLRPDLAPLTPSRRGTGHRRPARRLRC